MTARIPGHPSVGKAGTVVDNVDTVDTVDTADTVDTVGYRRGVVRAVAAWRGDLRCNVRTGK